ncbi:MAG TPA: diguanylate cyclase [Candidatus Hydrogenedentes bacterium]|nr:diguanylate cyclase [Candidatus Hydrogenedentota bacterium]HRK34067.1 diguanylate cyclase [Candidatus Hydrogenedentota bacterium]
MASTTHSISFPRAQYFERFYAAFDAALTHAVASEQPLSMALFDVDLFGTLNENHGRERADAVLEWLSGALGESFGSRAEVVRYGGDAFAAILPGVEKEEAFLLAESARGAIGGGGIVYDGDQTLKFSLTVSAGLASYPDDGATCVDIVRKANEALYRAKAGGRNKVCLAREERMVTKTSHYTQGQLAGLARLAKRMGVGEAVLLREALDDVLRKYNA